MFRIILFGEKKSYKKLFEKRFKESSNISCEKDDVEFFMNFIEAIEKKYENEIEKSDVREAYIEREKIRLETKLEYIKSTDLDLAYKYISILYPIIVSIIISFIGYILISTNNIVNFAIQNKIQSMSNLENINKIEEMYNYMTTVYKDYNMGNLNELTQYAAGGILCLGLIFVIALVMHSSSEVKANREIAFNKICLSVLEKL